MSSAFKFFLAMWYLCFQITTKWLYHPFICLIKLWPLFDYPGWSLLGGAYGQLRCKFLSPNLRTLRVYSHQLVLWCQAFYQRYPNDGRRFLRGLPIVFLVASQLVCYHARSTQRKFLVKKRRRLFFIISIFCLWSQVNSDEPKIAIKGI